MPLITRPRVTIPQGGVAVNWSHPLAKGLAVAVVNVGGAFFDAVSGTLFKVQQGPSQLVYKRGPVLKNNTAQFNAANLPVQPKPPSRAFTVASGFLCNAAAANGYDGLCSWNSSNSSLGVPFTFGTIVSTGNKLFVQTNDGSFNNGFGSVALSNGTYYDAMAAWSVNDLNLSMYLDGKLESSQSLGTTTLTSNTNTFGLFSHGDTVALCGFHGQAYLFVWNERKFTAAEAAQFYANPYQIFMPAQGIARYLNVPAAGGTTSSIGAAGATFGGQGAATIQTTISAVAAAGATFGGQGAATIQATISAVAAAGATFGGQGAATIQATVSAVAAAAKAYGGQAAATLIGSTSSLIAAAKAYAGQGATTIQIVTSIMTAAIKQYGGQAIQSGLAAPYNGIRRLAYILGFRF